ncbi:hypothetical protein GCM10027280_51060 [Micromonospora polyrhachis]|uniref:Uncharacterized protein n=1 Tax=Micromonospora polyrhachis TaxID=1282883 RepID=A0A7W7SXL7_9ACTN|nr:hypothetical protein [Micromonospora polyrhachis]MBB4961530.1 hypothetical protein [Micromonospora polyrhachis]
MATEAQLEEIIKGIEAQSTELKAARPNLTARRNAMLTSIYTVLGMLVRPPGRPKQLDDLADAFGRLGGQVEKLVDNVEVIARKRLPELWESSAGLSAREVVSATGKLMDRTQPAMRMAAKALREHAEQVRELAGQHERRYNRLVNVYNETAAADSREKLKDLAERALRLFELNQQVYRNSLKANDKLIKELKEVQRRAVAQRFEGMGAVNAVLLATATKGGKFKTILTEDEAKKAADLRKNLSPEENARLSALLSAAPTPEHQAYLLKALANGYSLDAVGKFAEQIKNKSPEWLANQPNLITPVAKPTSDNQNNNNQNNNQNQNATDPNATNQNANDQGQQTPQGGQNPAGSSSPSSSQPGGSDPSGQDPNNTGKSGNDTGNTTGQNGNTTGNTSDQSQQPDGDPTGGISARANPYWSDMATENPEGMANGLNKHSSELGTTYGAREVDRSDNDSVKTALKDSVAAVDKGHSVPVRIGEGDSQEWMLLIGRDGDELIFDNPEGKVVRVKEDDFLNGCMGDDKKSAVSSVVLPKDTAKATASA